MKLDTSKINVPRLYHNLKNISEFRNYCSLMNNRYNETVARIILDKEPDEFVWSCFGLQATLFPMQWMRENQNGYKLEDILNGMQNAYPFGIAYLHSIKPALAQHVIDLIADEEKPLASKIEPKHGRFFVAMHLTSRIQFFPLQALLLTIEKTSLFPNALLAETEIKQAKRFREFLNSTLIEYSNETLH